MGFSGSKNIVDIYGIKLFYCNNFLRGIITMVDGKTRLSELFKSDKKAAEIFKELGLKCPGCKGSSQDTVEKAAVNNGIRLNRILERLNRK